MSRIALLAGAVTGLVLALAAGALLGRRDAPKPVATQVVHVGAASLVVPSGWHLLSATESAAILEASAGQRAMVKLGAVSTPGRRARATMLAGYRAWREGTLTVLPTSAGVVTVACATCTDAIQEISVRGGAILDPTPDFALAIRAPDVVATLDQVRVRGRDALRQASTPADQSRWARRLAAAHASAAAALRTVAGPDLLERFADVRSAYSDLAGAATAGSSADFDAARTRIRTAETKLTRSLGDIAPARAQPRAAAPAPVMTQEVPRSLFVLVIIVFAGVGAGLALTGGRRRGEPVQPGPPPPPRWLSWLRTVVPQPPRPDRAQRARRPEPRRSVAERPAASQPVAEPRVAKARAAERPVAEPTVAKAQPAKRPAAKPAVAKARAAKRPATKPAVAKARAAKRPAAKPAVAQARAAKPAVAEPPVATARAAERPVAEPPCAKRPAPRREVPVPPNAKWTCELSWSASLRRAGFHVQATAPGEGTVEVARSRKVSWPPLMPPAPQAELVAAARSVAKALVEAGWTPTTRGSDWYAQRFAWARDGSPPTLGTVAR
jgi:hypothetical protein